MKRRIACGLAVAFTPRAQAQHQLALGNEGQGTQTQSLLERANLAALCRDLAGDQFVMLCGETVAAGGQTD